MEVNIKAGKRNDEDCIHAISFTITRLSSQLVADFQPKTHKATILTLRIATPPILLLSLVCSLARWFEAHDNGCHEVYSTSVSMKQQSMLMAAITHVVARLHNSLLLTTLTMVTEGCTSGSRAPFYRRCKSTTSRWTRFLSCNARSAIVFRNWSLWLLQGTPILDRCRHYSPVLTRSSHPGGRQS